MHPATRISKIAGMIFVGVAASPSWAQDADSACGASKVTGGDPTAPCFADVSDILGGQRYLLRTDDLVVSVEPSGDGMRTFENYLFDTTLLKPANPPEKQTVAETKCTETPQSTRLGRIYNLKYDVIVSYVFTEVRTPSGEVLCSPTVFVIDPGDDNKVLDQFGTFPSTEPRLALFDADLDGYDDIFVMGFDTNSEINSNVMWFFSARDVDDPTADLPFRFQKLLDSDYTPRSNVVTGDFNGDGAKDIAWVGAAAGGEVKVRFASVCPAKGWVVLGTTCTQGFEIVVSTETINTGQTWPETDTDPTLRMSLAAGDYDGVLAPDTGLSDAELVLIHMPSVSSTSPAALAFVYDFDAELKPTSPNDKGTQLTGSETLPPLGALPFVASGRLDWSDRKEQVVVGTSFNYRVDESDRSFQGLWVLSFADGLLIKQSDRLSTSLGVSVVGVAMGRFDPPPPPPDLDFNQQIAVLWAEEPCGGPDIPRCTVIDIYTATPPDFNLTRVEPARTVFLDSIPFTDQPLVTDPLQAGDLQGRSLRLGTPEKITIAHTQADTVLGMPPMHVDFIGPPENINEPEVFNVSVFPTTFNAQYSVSDTTGAKLSSKSTTSYTYARKESAQEKISYGIPDLGGVSVSAKQSATQKHQSTVSKQYNSYSTQSFSMTETTEYDDQVTFTTNRMNIYSYPVIGETVCPAGSTDCSDAEKLPLHVQFSGVDNDTHHKPTVGSVLEWYQPVHEPGNLFSYPGNQQQLSADQPQQGSEARYTQLAPPPAESTSWSSNANEQTTASWTSGGTEAKTAGSVSNHSFDASVSASGKVGIGGFGLSASASYDSSKSKSTSTLNSSTTSFDASTGVTLSQTKVLDTPEYSGETFIFGVKAPEGTIQTDLETNTDIKGQGALRVAYAADPLAPGSDVWWRQAYGPTVAGKPDVGLNHPQRWSQDNPTDPTPGAERVWFNCPIGHTSSPTSPACSPNTVAPTPANVALAPFYRIKGLFMTPGETTAGPSTNRATLGDTVTLQARVYNYSLTNMPDGAEVHAEFYAQPWGDGEFAPAPGDPDAFAPAVYIGKDMVPAIPAFCGGAETGQDTCLDNPERNWAFVEVTWDTTLDPPPADVTYWKFWVVTWIELGGELVPEIAEHGLTAIPDANLNSLADVPVETYSNNHGFYNQIITLLPPSAGAGLATAGVESETEVAELRLEKLRVQNQRRRSGEPMSVQVKVESDRPVDDVVVNFYDGNPADDGILFDAETVPHLAAHQPFHLVVPYRRSACVKQRLYVEAFSISDDTRPAFAETRRKIRPDLDCRKAKG